MTVLRALTLAWLDLLRPRILRLALMGIGLTILLFVALQTAVFWAVRSFVPGGFSLPWIGTLDVGSALSWGSLALFPLMGFFLMAPVAAGFAGLFAEQVADAVEEIHYRYAMAGADIVETNTFSATTIAQADYGMQGAVHDLNVEGARIVRRALDRATAQDGRPRFVAGAIGPTNRTASISPDVNNPGYRAVTFDDLRVAYLQQAQGLIEGGADILLIETIFDTLNAKAAIFACIQAMEAHGRALPLMISGTITDASGRTLSGQTPTAFWYSVRHARPWSVGLNCALGASAMRPHLAELSGVAETNICAYPNAGLPNAFGQYDEGPNDTAVQVAEFAREGLVNVVGGCCGTTPDHIRAIAEAVAQYSPRKVPEYV